MSNSITKKISNHFYKGRYFAAKKLMMEYIANGNTISTDKLAYIFGITFFYTNDLDETKKYLDLAASLTSSNDIRIKIVLTYRRMGEFRKAKTILVALVKDESYKECLGYYLLGKTEFFAGNYETALKLFQTCLHLNGNAEYLESIDRYIVKSQNHLLNNTSKIDYKVFKDFVGSISRGHIVYLKKPKNSTASDDLGFYKRPYLIFDIACDTAYTLGLASEPITPFKLPANLCNSPTDKYILTKVTTININDIESVVGQIDPKYYSEITYYLYHSYHNYFDKSLPLIPTKLNEVLLSNVLVIYNEETQEEEYFFVYGIEDDHYKTIRLNVIDGIFIPSDEARDILKNTKFYDVVPLSNDIVDYLNYAISSLVPNSR